MLSEYHQSSPACTLTTHPPQVAFCLDEPAVEFLPPDVDEFLPVPVTSGAVTVVEVVFVVPFWFRPTADTMPEDGDPVLFVADAAIEPPVPSNSRAGADEAASSTEVVLSGP
jgi:hypothetical protein